MNPSPGVRYGLLRYTTWNIGDEIQSIAARQFVPQVDTWLDRDQIGTETSRLDTPTKVILNAWWLHGDDWPPRGDMLEPLLISMFLDHHHPAARRAFLSPASLDFLRAHGPVGARDQATLAFLEEQSVPAYFSGCLTLTLQRDPDVRRQDFVVAVDLPQPVLAALKLRTDRPVVELTAYHEPTLSPEHRIRLAELYLLAFQSASMVLTTRLHALLPSLAFDTPALLVRTPSTFDPLRFQGLADLAYTCSAEEFVAGEGAIDLARLTENPQRHLSLRAELIDRAHGFTGYGPQAPRVNSMLTGPENLPWIASLVGDQVRKARAGHKANVVAPRRSLAARAARRVGRYLPPR